jgi:hypothetical protein
MNVRFLLTLWQLLCAKIGRYDDFSQTSKLQIDAMAKDVFQHENEKR